MHQKIILCDRGASRRHRAIAGVGTVNLDNRSFFLNFEVMTFAIKSDHQQHDLVENVEKMLENDFGASRLIDLKEYKQRPFWFGLSAEVTRLFAPIL